MFSDPYSLISANLFLLAIIGVVLGHQMWKLAEAEREIKRLKGDIRAMLRREYFAAEFDIPITGADAMEEMACIGEEAESSSHSGARHE